MNLRKKFFLVLFMFLPLMATAALNVSVNGTTYVVPQTGEKGWGNNVTSLLVALAQNSLQPTGGLFNLSADLDYGTSYGLKSVYYKSRGTNVATTGLVRLLNTDFVSWRNNANTANLSLGLLSDKLQFNSIDLVDVSTAQVLTGKSISGATNTITGIPSASTSVTPSGNLSSTDGQAALVELQVDVDTRALTSALTSHTSATTAVHGIANTANLATLAGAETLTNKIINSPTINTPTVDVLSATGQATTPSVLPSAGNYKLYVSNVTNKLTVLDSTGTASSVGAGAGTKNFIVNGDAEAGVTGFTTYLNTAQAIPVTGTGGAPTLTITASATSPLSETKSFILSHGASNQLGQGVSAPLTIDSASKAKVLQISFDYIVNSGTFQAGSSTQDSDIEVYIYDITNGVVIQPSSYKLLSNSLTVADRFVANFQTASNSTSYRLIFHNALATATAFDLKVDNVNVGPSNYVFGTPITDWASYTPIFSNLGTVTGSDFRWRRVGDSMQIYGNFTTGTPGASFAKVSLPSGLSMDTNKVNATGHIFGDIVRFAAGATTRKRAKVFGQGSDPTNLYFTNDDYTTARGPNSGLTGTEMFGGSEGQAMQALNIPILGWSSSVQMSDSFDGRIVAAKYRTSSSQTITSTPTVIGTTILDNDTHGAFSTTNNFFTCVVPGVYRVGASVTTVGLATASTLTVSAYKNGAADSAIGLSSQSPSGATVRSVSGSTPVTCRAGDTLSVFISSDVSVNLSGSSVNNYVTFEKMTGSSTIAATENIHARYAISAASTSTSFVSSVEKVVDYNFKIRDTHGAVTTGTGWKFTAPAAGLYRVLGSLYWSSTTNQSASQLKLYKNTTLDARIDGNITGGYITAPYPGIYLLAGESIELRAVQVDTAAAARAPITTGGETLSWISITRVGF